MLRKDLYSVIMINTKSPKFSQMKLPPCAYFENKTDNYDSKRRMEEELGHYCLRWVSMLLVD